MVGIHPGDHIPTRPLSLCFLTRTLVTNLCSSHPVQLQQWTMDVMYEVSLWYRLFSVALPPTLCHIILLSNSMTDFQRQPILVTRAERQDWRGGEGERQGRWDDKALGNSIPSIHTPPHPLQANEWMELIVISGFRSTGNNNFDSSSSIFQRMCLLF